ncbi:MAG TPA: Tex family protein, partial [Chloroflexota bacterium]|nr:Tex family protein [Chloroflexota bacterium]
IRDRLAQLAALDQRRLAILSSLQERNLLTAELRARLEGAATLTALEDLYLPFRPRRRTRAMIARERGLEPLARALMRQHPATDPQREALRYVTTPSPAGGADLAVPDPATALQGARDIIAEWVSEDPWARGRIRRLFATRGTLRSEVLTGKEAEGSKYRDYFSWSEPVAGAPSHRVLAIRRGAAEGILSFSIRPPEAEAVALLEGHFVTGRGPAAEEVRLAVLDGYKRLLAPALETEARTEARRRADGAAIDVFARNLRQLLLAPALGQRRVLAIDPGFRSGCKVVVLDAQGRLLHHDVVFPEQGPQRSREARETLTRLVQQHQVEAIAIGNGTAGRETEAFVRGLGLPPDLPIVMVNEAGASVYSASEVAREEFPDHDLTVRGAVSIGRRLMDPLAELVKIDPKSIGVGQYQHDVDQDALKQALDDVVTSCVNAVGVEVNTASRQLLAYVSGLNSGIAEAIVRYRGANGPFQSRRELLRVPRLGARTFEQAAGFLRIRGAANPLDASAVHPESYPLVDRMAAGLGVTVDRLLTDEELRRQIDPQEYVTPTVGMPTLNDILAELARPGRDPRQRFEVFRFAEGVSRLEDLSAGMTLPGIVTNITAFGAFVDVGVHQDGLVHVSQMAERRVRDPHQVVQVHQQVQVTVLEVDLARKRISLSLRPQRTATPSGGTGAR